MFGDAVTKKLLSNTIKLMNSILQDIPAKAWPEDKEEVNYVNVGQWHLNFNWVDDKMGANLCNANDDHTAWVVKKGKKFIDFDIGGS